MANIFDSAEKQRRVISPALLMNTSNEGNGQAAAFDINILENRPKTGDDNANGRSRSRGGNNNATVIIPKQHLRD